MKESFNYIELSDTNKLERADTGRIQLRSYSDDLLLYSRFDSNTDASYAISDANPTIGDTVSIENSGVFGQYAWVKNSGSVRYNSNNFANLTTEGSLKFRLRAGFNNDPGYQEFNATTVPTLSGDTYYKVKIFIENDIATGDTVRVLLQVGDSLNNIKNKLNTQFSTYDLTATVISGKLRVVGTVDGDSISMYAPSSGNSLITLLSGVGSPQMPNAPTTNTEFIKFAKASGDTNKISLTHTTSSHIILSMFDDVGDTVIYEDLGLWSNYYDSWYAFELSWNESITQLFINGSLFAVKLTNGFSRDANTYLYAKASAGNSYRFDELIVYNTYQNTKNYTVETLALSQYATDDPYADLYFSETLSDGTVTDLNLLANQNCRFVVKIGGTWNYYLAGAWRVSDGSYAQSTTPAYMETQFPNLTFTSGAQIIIRTYLHSDGTYQTYLDSIDIIVETGEAEPATITGTVSLENPVDLSSNYNVIISTDQGSMEVNVASAAGSPSAVTMDEIKTSIINAAVLGLATPSDDGSYHLVLSTETIGDSASISIASGTTNDALALIWGYVATDEGEAATGDITDYSELFRYVRGKLGEPQIPAEITDEQLEDCLTDAVYQYNRYRNFKEELLYFNLSGDWKDGYEIPAIIGGEENILEVILSPRFPFTYYAGRTDLMANLFVTALFQRYSGGFSQALSDYYITLTMEEDINIILGTQIKWEILNNKLFIHPEPSTMNAAIRYRAALTPAQIVTNYWIRSWILAEAKLVLGTIRSTFKNGVPGGNEMIQLNGDDLRTEGQAEKERLTDEMKKSQEPTFLEFG